MQMPDVTRPLDMKGRVVIITGGAGDIGSATAEQAARLGATVVIVDNGTSVTGIGEDPGRTEQAVERLAAEYDSVVGRFCDVTDAEQVESLFDEMFAEYGTVDAVIAAAGTLRVKPIWETSLEDWHNVLESHATHTFLIAAAACRRWRDASTGRSGSPCSLVTFTAATGLVGRPDLGVTHSAAKGAIAAMTMELAHEMYPYGVSVNAVAAANVRGRMHEHVAANASEARETFDTRSPGHCGVLAAYLASSDAAWITGQVFRVVGGLIGRYSPWEVTESLEREGFWTADDVRLGLRRLFGVYPEYKAIQGRHRSF